MLPKCLHGILKVRHVARYLRLIHTALRAFCVVVHRPIDLNRLLNVFPEILNLKPFHRDTSCHATPQNVNRVVIYFDI